MDHDLEEFLGEEARAHPTHATEATVARDLLVFEYGVDRYGLLAMQVDAVIGWQKPAPVPGANRMVHGVIQDRGRIVVILAHPAGATGRTADNCKRIIICRTSRGLLGLPATVTNVVTSLQLRAQLTHASLHDGELGAFTFIDPEFYLETR